MIQKGEKEEEERGMAEWEPVTRTQFFIYYVCSMTK